jgi:lipid-binding SYLF domain-containing protein
MLYQLRNLTVAGALVLSACQAGNPLDTGSGADKAAALRAECDQALDQLYAQVEQTESIVEQAQGTLVFPNVTSAGLGVGAETGNGCLYEDGVVNSYFNKSGASIGFQAGAQSRSEVLVLTSEAAMEKLTSAAGLDFGGNVTATVVDTGVGAQIDTKQLLSNEIIAFIFGETGLMAGATVEGTKVTELSFEG